MSTTDDMPPPAATFTIDPPEDLAAKGQKSLEVTENAFEFVYEPQGWTRSAAPRHVEEQIPADLEDDGDADDEDVPAPAPAKTKAPAKKTTARRRTGPPPTSS